MFRNADTARQTSGMNYSFGLLFHMGTQGFQL